MSQVINSSTKGTVLMSCNQTNKFSRCKFSQLGLESGEIGEKHLACGTQVLLELDGKHYPVRVMGTEVGQRKKHMRVECDSEETETNSGKGKNRGGSRNIR